MHERIQAAFPPLIQGSRASRGQRSAEDRVQKCERIYRTVRAQIKTDGGSEQDEKRQPRFDQLRKIRKHSAGGRVGFHRG